MQKYLTENMHLNKSVKNWKYLLLMRFFKTKGFFGEWGYECNFTLNFEVGKKKKFI